MPTNRTAHPLSRWSRLLLAAFALIASSLLAACADDDQPDNVLPTPTVEESGAETSTPDAQATSGATSSTAAAGAADIATTSWEPLPSDECDPLRDSIEEQVGGDATTSDDEEFTHGASGASGTGCTLVLEGTGDDYENFVAIARTIEEVLTSNGWTQNTRLLADGPTGTAAGYEKDRALALVSVAVEPEEGVACPTDQPISTCFEELEPSQLRYRTEVIFAQPAG